MINEKQEKMKDFHIEVNSLKKEISELEFAKV